MDFFFFCLYFHLYVNPSPDLGWGLRDSSVRLVNAFARTYSDDGEKLIRPCSPEAIYHFRGVAVCRCVRAPEPFQFFASLPFKKNTFDGNFTNSGDKRKSNRTVFDIVNVDFKAGNGGFFFRPHRKKAVGSIPTPAFLGGVCIIVWCGWLIVSRNWPGPAFTLSQPGSWLY